MNPSLRISLAGKPMIARHYQSAKMPKIKGVYGMATKDERLKALEQKQAQIKAQIQALKSRDNAQERKDDTRRKVLIGGFVLAQMRKKGIGYNQMAYENVRFIETLSNERDLALFGLAAKPALSPTGEAGGTVSNTAS
jgi:large subunit ribosomal protein L7/L12